MGGTIRSVCRTAAASEKERAQMICPRCGKKTWFDTVRCKKCGWTAGATSSASDHERKATTDVVVPTQPSSTSDDKVAAVSKLTNSAAILELALTTIDEKVREAALDKLDQSTILELVLKTEDVADMMQKNLFQKNLGGSGHNNTSLLRGYNIHVSALKKMNVSLRRKWNELGLETVVSGRKRRDDVLRSMAAHIDSEDRAIVKEQLASAAASGTDEGREVTFSIPCGFCGYKTNVSVRIDWGGSILSGDATDHEFPCQNCKAIFAVSKESLKQYTDRFV